MGVKSNERTMKTSLLSIVFFFNAGLNGVLKYRVKRAVFDKREAVMF